MDKQEEIEKIARVIETTKKPCDCLCISECLTKYPNCKLRDLKECSCLGFVQAEALCSAGYGDIKAAAKEAVTGFQSKLTKWLAKQYRESSTVEITAVLMKIEELLEETK